MTTLAEANSGRSASLQSAQTHWGRVGISVAAAFSVAAEPPELSSASKFYGTSNGPIRRVPEGTGVHLVVVCMDSSFTDNEMKVIKKTKSI